MESGACQTDVADDTFLLKPNELLIARSEDGRTECYASTNLDVQSWIVGVCNIVAGPFRELWSWRHSEAYGAGGLCFAQHRRHRSTADCDCSLRADASWNGAPRAGHDAGDQGPISRGQDLWVSGRAGHADDFLGQGKHTTEGLRLDLRP